MPERYTRLAKEARLLNLTRLAMQAADGIVITANATSTASELAQALGVLHATKASARAGRRVLNLNLSAELCLLTDPAVTLDSSHGISRRPPADITALRARLIPVLAPLTADLTRPRPT